MAWPDGGDGGATEIPNETQHYCTGLRNLRLAENERNSSYGNRQKPEDPGQKAMRSDFCNTGTGALAY